MPVSFLTEDQRNNYGRYIGAPTDKELACFFHMSDDDQILLMRRRGNHNKLGFALQLGTVRFLGKFLEDPMDIPDLVIQAMAAKLNINEFENIHEYRTGEQRWDHANIFYNASLLSGLYEYYKQNNMEEECLKIIRLSPVAWQHINLIGIYEFYNDKECLNLHDVIEKLVNNKKIGLLAAA